MAQTRINPLDQIGSGSILRTHLNTTTAGSAVITRLLAGTGVTLSSTGVDAGTGDVTINAASGGGSGNAGTAILDFGTGGNSTASVAVIGQSNITATSRVYAQITAVATADHSADEHVIEAMTVAAGPPTAGTGFTIYGRSDNLPIFGRWSVNWLWV